MAKQEEPKPTPTPQGPPPPPPEGQQPPPAGPPPPTGPPGTVPMVRSEPQHPKGPVSADVHPAEVEHMELHGWRRK